MKLSRILAPTDFSRFSGFALEWAANLAEALRAGLILLHVVPEEEGKIIEEVIAEGAAVNIPRGVRESVLKERQKKFQEQFHGKHILSIWGRSLDTGSPHVHL